MTGRKNSFFKPINDTTVVEQVIDRLTNAMINKEIRPGDKLPPEMELASIFGVGRNSIREAIKVLTSYGVLETRRPEGTFVTHGFSDRMINPLLYGIILGQSDSIDSLKELCEMIDFGILQLAATKATDEDIKLLSERLDTLKSRLKTNPNNINNNNNTQSPNDEKYKKFFYNTENLENIYNILKGEEKQLKKETVKKLIQDFEGVEYDEIKEENKNSSNHISSTKFVTSSKDKDSSANSSNEAKENNISEIDEKLNNGEYISFEEFCNIFKNIYDSSQNPNKIFLEGFCYMDKDK